MIKKHVFIPKWLAEELKRAVKESYFASEAEAFRSGLLAILYSTRKLELPLQFYEVVRQSLMESASYLRGGNIQLALQKVEAVRIALKGRACESAEPEYVQACELLDRLLDDTANYLHLLVMGMREGYTVEDIALDLESLSKSYRDLAEARIKGIGKSARV